VWFHPDVSFFLFTGLVLVLGVAFVYLAANVGVAVFYWREHKGEFNWLWHAILPLVSGLVLLYAIYQSFPPGCPAVNCPVDPYAKAPLIAGGWLVVGIVLLVYYAASGRAEWLKTAGAALGESEDDLAMARVSPAGASAKV
jgi:amino acid transporter